MPVRGRITARIKDPRIEAEIQNLYDGLQNLKLDGGNINALSVAQAVGKAMKDGQLEPLNRFLRGELQGQRILLSNDLPADGVTLYINRPAFTGAVFGAAFFASANAGVETVLIEHQAKGPALKMSNVGAGGVTGIEDDSLCYLSNPGTGDSILVVAGATTAKLTAAGIWTDASSRDSKERFVILDGALLLGKIKALPVYEFQYKHQPNRRHFGPTSEDFHAEFKLGDDKGISGRDLAAVSLAGVKALLNRVESLENRVKELETKHANCSCQSG